MARTDIVLNEGSKLVIKARPWEFRALITEKEMDGETTFIAVDAYRENKVDGGTYTAHLNLKRILYFY